MARLEARIKEFVHEAGVDVVGIAGPGRLDGPPSLDPSYCMKEARSIVSMAIPMDTQAIYDFLSKRSPTPHNVDQSHGNQRMHRVSQELAGFIREQGHAATVVPPNNTYRRSPDVFATHPSFSHRFGAIASGIGAQGWSGNVMTREHGAAVYLGTVLTDALLESDEALPPRHFIDSSCASCFGLHALSEDKEWTTWGPYWIKEWVGRRPGAGRLEVRRKLMQRGGSTGDSAARFELIRRTGKTLFSMELMEALPLPDELPDDQAERNRILREHAALVGVTGFHDPNVLTCGQCALVCGPTVAETKRRFEALAEGGLVVRGARPGEMAHASSYDEALTLRAARPRLARSDLVKDSLASMVLWHRRYFGIEPRSIAGGIAYQWKLKRALRRDKA